MHLSGNEKTILAVDDDSAVLNLLGAILRPLGFTILSASSGLEAMQLAEKSAGNIDLLLSDVVMPEMGGPELAVRLRERYPEVEVMFISGFMKPGLDEDLYPGRAPGFLRKPFTPSELISKLREYFRPSGENTCK
jgi:two-component system cell cycle sensor histidine kinase/response regulator CckA